jgi:predicted SAM-dependent methyltransferase
MRQWLKQIRMLRYGMRLRVRLGRAYNRYRGPRRLRKMLAGSSPVKIVIGSSGRHDPDWTPTDMEFLNLLKPADWSRFFQPGSVDAILAEHVWEHLTEEQARDAARTCFTYLKHGGYLRVAVPDGLHPSPEYLEWVRVGGASPGQLANDHKVLYTYTTLRDVFESSGFKVDLYEYFDEAGTFHYRDWDEKAGTIWRSKRFDKRNTGGNLAFTSIILDAVKQ